MRRSKSAATGTEREKTGSERVFWPRPQSCGQGSSFPLSARLLVPLQALHAVWYAKKLACRADRACRSLLAQATNFKRDLVDTAHEKPRRRGRVIAAADPIRHGRRPSYCYASLSRATPVDERLPRPPAPQKAECCSPTTATPRFANGVERSRRRPRWQIYVKAQNGSSTECRIGHQGAALKP